MKKLTALLITLLATSAYSTPEYGDVYEDVEPYKSHQVCYNVRFPDNSKKVFYYFVDVQKYAKRKKYGRFQYRDCAEYYPYKTHVATVK